MKKITLLFLFTSFTLFSQTKDEIVNKFLNFVDSKKIIQFSIIESFHDDANGDKKDSAICTFKKNKEDTLIGFNYNIKVGIMTYIYNEKEYLEYYPEFYGNKTVKVYNLKKPDKYFYGSEIIIKGDTFHTPSVPQSNIFYEASIFGHYNKFKKKDVNDNGIWTVSSDTIIENQLCCCIIYKKPTIYDGDTNVMSSTYYFNKLNGMLLYYKFLHPVQQRGEFYSNFKYDNPKFNVLLTRKAFPKGFKFSENPKNIYDENHKPLNNGQKAPGWELMNLENKQITLESLQGTPVFLIFSEIGCVPCMSAIPVFNDLLKEYPNLKIISIYAKDKKEALKKMVAKKQINYEILYNSLTDDAKKTSEIYHISGYPTYYLIDKNGIIRYSGSGYGDGMKRVWVKEIEKVMK